MERSQVECLLTSLFGQIMSMVRTLILDEPDSDQNISVVMNTSTANPKNKEKSLKSLISKNLNEHIVASINDTLLAIIQQIANDISLKSLQISVRNILVIPVNKLNIADNNTNAVGNIDPTVNIYEESLDNWVEIDAKSTMEIKYGSKDTKRSKN